MYNASILCILYSDIETRILFETDYVHVGICNEWMWYSNDVNNGRSKKNTITPGGCWFCFFSDFFFYRLLTIVYNAWTSETRDTDKTKEKKTNNLTINNISGRYSPQTTLSNGLIQSETKKIKNDINIILHLIKIVLDTTFVG